MPTDKPRYTITVDPELQRKIEDYQFNNRIKTQTKAIIALMELGLQKLQTDLPITQNQPVSEIYSIVEKQLIEDYRGLNEQGQAVVRDHMEMVAATPKYKKYSDISIEKHA